MGDAAEDVLGLDTSGAVSVTGTTVSVGGVAIGTITSDGTGGNPLVVTFNANATPARVSTLAQALTYRNTDTGAPTAGLRSIAVTVRDSAPGPGSAVSMVQTLTVDVRQVADAAVLLSLDPGLPPDFQQQTQLAAEPVGFNGDSIQREFAPDQYVLPAVAESVRQRDAMAMKMVGAFTTMDVSEVQSESLAPSGLVDRALFVLPAVRAVQLEAAEAQARAQLVSSRLAAPGTDVAFSAGEGLAGGRPLAKAPFGAQPGTSEGDPAEAAGTPLPTADVRISELPGEDDSAASELDFVLDNFGGAPQTEDADGLTRDDAQAKDFMSFRSDPSQRPIGAASFASLLREESAKLRAGPFAGGGSSARWAG